MSESTWQKQGATLSHKNACKEFGLTEDEVIEALKKGRLQYQQNHDRGNPYFKLLRVEDKSLAQELHGTKFVEEQEVKHNIQRINKEVNGLKRKLTASEKQKLELIEIHKQTKA